MDIPRFLETFLMPPEFGSVACVAKLSENATAYTFSPIVANGMHCSNVKGLPQRSLVKNGNTRREPKIGGLIGSLGHMQMSRARRAASCAGLYGISLREPAVSDESTGWPEAQKRRCRVHARADRCWKLRRREHEAAMLLDAARFNTGEDAG